MRTAREALIRGDGLSSDCCQPVTKTGPSPCMFGYGSTAECQAADRSFPSFGYTLEELT